MFIYFKKNRFDAEKREWKERGLGDIKLQMHRENARVRVLMRREHTFKVCANHVVTEDLKIEPMLGSDKALTYYTPDHSGILYTHAYTHTHTHTHTYLCICVCVCVLYIYTYIYTYIYIYRYIYR